MVKRKRLYVPYLISLTLLLPGLASAQSLTRGPYVQLGESGGKTAAYVSWYTDRISDSRVEVSGPEGIRLTLVDKQDSKHHIVLIPGLTPSTEYTYSVYSDGKPLAEGLSFKTAVDDDAKIRFAVVGDSGEGNSAQRGVANRMDSRHPDFVLHTGDVVYEDGEDRDYPENFYEPYTELLTYSFFMPTIGNHDDRTKNGAPLLENFILPHGVVDDDVVHPEENYSFDWGNLHIATVNSDRYDDEPRIFRETILPWLRDDLMASTKPWKIVFFHHHPYSDSLTHDDIEEIKDWVVPILQETGVRIVFNGHSHDYQRFRPLWNNRVQSSYGDQGILYLVSGAGGSDLYRVRPTNRLAAWDQENFSFTLVDVEGTDIRIRQISRSGETLDDFSLQQEQTDSFDWLGRSRGTSFFHLKRDSSQAGYSQLEKASESPRQGLAWLRQESKAGTQALTPVGSQIEQKIHHIFVQENQKIMTNLSIVNTGSNPASVTIEAFDSQGKSKARRQISLGVSRQEATALIELLPDLRLPYEGLITVSSSLPVSVVSIRSIRIPSGVNLATLPPFLEPSADLVIPYLPTESLLQGGIIMANPGGSRAEGRVEFTEYNTGRQISRPYDLASNASTVLETGFLGRGTWRVELNPSTSTIPAFCAIWQAMRSSGDLLQTVLTPRFPAETSTFPVEIAGQQTVSFAIHNPFRRTATVKLTLRDSAGKFISRKQFDLDENGSRVFYLPDLIEESATLFRGSLEITSSQKILSEAFLSVLTDSLTLVSAFPYWESSDKTSPITIPLVAFMKNALWTDLWVSSPDSVDRKQHLRLKLPSGSALKVYQRH